MSDIWQPHHGCFRFICSVCAYFVMPIAIAGSNNLPVDANPDLYVLTLPLAFERQDLALLAFLGGFSSATSMVIVAAIAVSTMVSNHIVMPIAINFLNRGSEVSGDVAAFAAHHAADEHRGSPRARLLVFQANGWQ